MAPSGNSIPERFRQQKPFPNFSDLTKSEKSSKSDAEAQKNWENLLDRRKKCKERQLKVEIFDSRSNI